MIHITRSQSKDSFLIGIDGKQKEYPIQELSSDFVSWNLGQRTAVLRHMLAAVGSKEPPKHAGGGFGAHLPVYMTYNPQESLFPVNAANKGTGFVAKEAYLDYYLDKFRAVYQQTEVSDDASPSEKEAAIRTRIQTILEFYENIDKIDLRCLAGLEIWPGTSSKNVLLDPRVSLHFMGMPTHGQSMRYNQWQVNCIWEKIEPADKRFEFGVALRQLTMGHIGKSFVPGHIPSEQTPIRGKHPFGWTLWVIQTLDKGIEAIHNGH
ncbi:MAG TPA: hypothetical protein VND99_05725 [Candidatus Acidoferrales bacterium]|nr:hypothetical protein [Candidatus Acidoferrales bacterium]